MKYVKMLGLAAVAAAALMSSVGASNASASVFCTTRELTTCPKGWAESALTTVHAVSVGSLELTTAFKNIACSESTVHGRTADEGHLILNESVTFGGCNCTVNVLANGELEVNWIEGTSNGTLTFKGFEVTASCSTIFGNVHCIYATGSSTDVGTLTGGEEATMDIEESNIPRLTTSSACSAEAHWDGKYRITTPKPIYVAGHT